MLRTTLLLLVVLVAACSTVEEGGVGTPATGVTTTVAPTTVAPAETTTAAPTSTEAPTTSTTTTTIAPAPGTAAITRVVFEPAPYALITNVGSLPVDLVGNMLVSRDRSAELPQTMLAAGETVGIALGGSPPELVGVVGVIDLGDQLGVIAPGDGELALYATPRLNDPSAMIDYVEWGSTGHGRSGVAVDAGLWEDGAFVEVPPEAVSISSSGRPGAGPEDWFADVGG